WQTLAGRRAARRRKVPRQTSRKGTSRVLHYRIRKQTAELSPPAAAKRGPPLLALALPGAHAGPAHSARDADAASGANMNSIAATLIIRERLQLAVSGRVCRRVFVRWLRRAYHFRAGIVRG